MKGLLIVVCPRHRFGCDDCTTRSTALPLNRRRMDPFRCGRRPSVSPCLARTRSGEVRPVVMAGRVQIDFDPPVLLGRVLQELLRHRKIVFLNEVDQSGGPEPHAIRQRCHTAFAASVDERVRFVRTVKPVGQVGTHHQRNHTAGAEVFEQLVLIRPRLRGDEIAHGRIGAGSKGELAKADHRLQFHDRLRCHRHLVGITVKDSPLPTDPEDRSHMDQSRDPMPLRRRDATGVGVVSTYVDP